PRRRHPLARRDRRLELVLRRIDALGLPGPEVAVAPAGGASGHVLERPGLLVDVREVDEDLGDVLVPWVPVPLLRLDALRRSRIGDRVPVVEVDQPGLLAAVAVDDVEERAREGE